MAIAEALLLCFAEGIATQLGSLSAKHLGPFFCVKDDLQALQKTVSMVNAVLLDAEEQQAQNHAIKLWLENLTDAFYDADDLLDDLSTQVQLREANEVCVYLFFSKLADCVEMGPQIQPLLRHADKVCASVCLFFHKLADGVVDSVVMSPKIKALRKRFDVIADDRQKFHLKEHPVDTRVRNREREYTFSFVRQEEVIGRDHDQKSVIEFLMDSNIEENVSILAIVGIGGLGKTTLAKHIFSDEKIKESFEVKMWVCVSEIFEVQKIVEVMLELATKKKPETTVLETLVDNLKKEIDGKKYFLVLDDLWNEDCDKWMRLETLLVGGARGSKILVTTRSEKVAGIIKSAKQHSLKGLDEDASWCLFKQMAFKKGEERDNSRFVAIGKEILGKCAGVPLAIKIIGRQLYLRNTENQWSSFLTNELLRIKEDEILSILKVSYDQLPSYLKQCFAYCSLFPKDYDIHKSTLVRLWMAQGFIHLSDQDQCFEDVGNEYFMDLVWRSFFQEAKLDKYGDVISCKMHDLVHDLAVSVAGSLITTFDCDKEAIDVKARHLWIDDRKPPRVVPNFKENRMRTIIFQLLPPRYLPQLNYDIRTNYLSFCDSLKFLRALDVSSGRFLGLECSIGDSKQLRYLDLSDNDSIRKLPDSITRLQNLQTLSLNGCRELQELHKDMKNLVNLRHLEIEDCDSLTHMPRGMGQMTNLQTLSKFVLSRGSISADSGGLNELKRLNNLRGTLVIEGLRCGKDAELESKAADLKEKQYLQFLLLKWPIDINDKVVGGEMLLEGLQPHPNLKKLEVLGYPGVRFPNWLLSLTNLVDLRLAFCKNLQYLPPLSQLPSLESLTLLRLNDLEYIQSDNGDSNNMFSASSTTPFTFFPSLKRIYLDYCPQLEGWWRRDPVEITSMTEQPLIPSFPRLSSFMVTWCPMLTSTPTFPHLEEKLGLDGASWKPVQQTMMTYVAAPQCPSTAIASSFNPLSKLKRLRLHRIADLQSVPEEGLRNLNGLRYLEIHGCHSLQSLSRGIQHLTALQGLRLSYCNELDLGNDEDGMQWQGLTSLRSLTLSALPKLESLPPGLQHLTTLRRLHIKGLGFTALPEWIHNWTSLEDLTIDSCRELVLSSCNELDLGNDGDGMQWQRLTSLRSLTLSNLPKLESLPPGLQHLTTLRHLHIEGLGFTALPEWIHNWTSLEDLTIRDCPSLASLPEGMLRLTSLRMLMIDRCAILTPRCKRETGEDWPKIAHIPRFELDKNYWSRLTID